MQVINKRKRVANTGIAVWVRSEIIGHVLNY